MEEPKELENKQDAYTKSIGEIGRWQMFVFAIVAVPSRIMIPSAHFGIIFMAPKTTFRCLDKVNSSEEVLNMTCYSDCKVYEYHSEIENNIIKEWDLICERAWLADFAQMICMFGVLIGNGVFGVISDRYGRRMSLMLAGALETCTSFAIPFCPNLWSFFAVRFLLGAATGGTMMTSIVLLMEIFGPSKRELLGSIYLVPVIVGVTLMSTITYYVRTWRVFNFVFGVPTLVYLTYPFCLPESPKWLISVGRLDEACIIMTSAAKWNKLPETDMKAVVESIANERKAQKVQRKATLGDLVTVPSLRKKTLGSCFIWFTSGISFYGSYIYFGQTIPNVFLTFFLVGITQLPGIFIGLYVSKKVGRRGAVMGIYIISAIGNAMLVLSDEWYYTKVVMGTIAVGSGGAGLALMYVYSSELFPTVARNMGMGASSTASRVGSMLAPLVVGLRTGVPAAPPAVFAAAPALAALACCWLPETRGKELDDHLDEA